MCFYEEESDPRFADLERAEEAQDNAHEALLWEHPCILALGEILGDDPLSVQPEAMTALSDELFSSDPWGRTCTDEATTDMRA